MQSTYNEYGKAENGVQIVYLKRRQFVATNDKKRPEMVRSAG
jgi:hypothetical protein